MTTRKIRARFAKNRAFLLRPTRKNKNACGCIKNRNTIIFQYIIKCYTQVYPYGELAYFLKKRTL